MKMTIRISTWLFLSLSTKPDLAIFLHQSVSDLQKLPSLWPTAIHAGLWGL